MRRRRVPAPWPRRRRRIAGRLARSPPRRRCRCATGTRCGGEDTHDRVRRRSPPGSAAALRAAPVARRPAPRGRHRRAGPRGQDDALGALAGRPGGGRAAAPPHPLGRRRAGGAAFLPDGSLLFTSSRPDPDAKPDPEKKIDALWLLPPDGGEARLLAAPEGGVDGVVTARSAPVVAFGARMFPGAVDVAADAERGLARKEAGVGALLFEDDYPIRHWDHWLAPRRRRLFGATLAADPEAPLRLPRRPARRRDADVRGDRDATCRRTGRSSSRRATTFERCPRSARISSPSTWARERPASSRPATPGTTHPPSHPTDGPWPRSGRTFGTPDEASRVTLG